MDEGVQGGIELMQNMQKKVKLSWMNGEMNTIIGSLILIYSSVVRFFIGVIITRNFDPVPSALY